MSDMSTGELIYPEEWRNQSARENHTNLHIATAIFGLFVLTGLLCFFFSGYFRYSFYHIQTSFVQRSFWINETNKEIFSLTTPYLVFDSMNFSHFIHKFRPLFKSRRGGQRGRRILSGVLFHVSNQCLKWRSRSNSFHVTLLTYLICWHVWLLCKWNSGRDCLQVYQGSSVSYRRLTWPEREVCSSYSFLSFCWIILPAPCMWGSLLCSGVLFWMLAELLSTLGRRSLLLILR